MRPILFINAIPIIVLSFIHYAFNISIFLADVLQPLHADFGQLQRQTARPAGHVDRGFPFYSDWSIAAVICGITSRILAAAEVFLSHPKQVAWLAIGAYHL